VAFSFKTKQVAGVTLIVTLAVVLLSIWYISTIVGVRLGETRARADMVAKSIIHRLTVIVPESADPVTTLQQDGGLQTILQSSAYSDTLLYAAIVDPRGVVLAHSDPEAVGKPAQAVQLIDSLFELSPLSQAWAIYFHSDQLSFELQQPLFLERTESADKTAFGSVRIGVSTLLVRQQFAEEMGTPIKVALGAIVIAAIVSMLLAQLTLRPIHVIRSGLARLGRGELDVSVDLSADAELSGLGDSFKAVSARLAADRSELAGQRATLESVVERLEDAVALVSTDGTVLFSNPAMRPVIADGNITTLLPATHPYRKAVERVLEQRASTEAQTITLPEGGERLVLAHPFESPDGELMGVMLVARNLSYLSQVETTLSYSRKLAALGRLSAGIAHEVKNPLNATMIHLELLKMKLGDFPDALDHVSVIVAQVRRLDEVVQGFLKFTRPEDLKLQPVALPALFDEIRQVIDVEATPRNIEVRLELPADLPPVHADPGMLQQAFLNLALNAVQAMPNGGKLRITAAKQRLGQVEIVFQDSGVGISPENLERIFDLYFTTKERGSGIGLSLVYRTIQLHDGDIEVQSTLGHGTRFRILLHESATGTRRPPQVPNILGLRDRESLQPDAPISAS
jgi:signal transduction histidine kinase